VRTAFTELMGCEVPIQSAPMGGIVTPELVAAVTTAGAMACVGLAGVPARGVRQIVAAAASAARGPWGANFMIPVLDKDCVEIAAATVPYVDFYHGDPDAALVEMVHAGGAKAGWQVGSLAHALAAVDAGVDLLVVRGIEGGGRMWGHQSLWPLLVEILDAVNLPVLAAGGIADGRGLAAAVAAGAAGVRMGTRFVATDECGAHPLYKQAVTEAAADESVLTNLFSVMWPPGPSPARILQRSIDAASGLPDGLIGEMRMGPDVMPIQRFAVPPPTASATGHVEAMPFYAGESAGLISRIEPAGEVVGRIAADAEARLRRAAAL
jgi:nitronate monooxygenase